HVPSSGESEIRPEAGVHCQVLELYAVAIRVVIQKTAIAGIVRCDIGVVRFSQIARDGEIGSKGKRSVETVRLRVPGHRFASGAIGEHHAYAASAQQVVLDAEYGKVAGSRFENVVVSGLRVDETDGPWPRTSAQAASGANGHDLAVGKSDIATVEEQRG